MNGAAPVDAASQSATEALLEDSWEHRGRSASERELIVDAAAGAGFAAAAGALVVIGGLTGLRPGLALLLVVLYALVGRIEFPVGAGYVVPTQLILVPMLVTLPPAAVPLAVGAGLLLGNGAEWAIGRVQPRRVLSALPDAWHAIGPAAVLVAAGSPRIGFDELALLAGALAAGCALDLASSLVRMRLARVGPDLAVQLRVIGIVWVVDAGLAPLGFLAANAMSRSDFAILFVAPCVLLLWMLARDRSQRIDQAHHRLTLVQRERARLQSAVRRLGDAFAAKLELGGLLEILLHGSVEALDAAAGRLEFSDTTGTRDLRAGDEDRREELAAGDDHGCDGVAQIQHGTTWRLSVPVRVTASPRDATGRLSLVRDERPFEGDEIALIGELIHKAQLSAAEIIANDALREQAMTDALTGLHNRRRLTADLTRSLTAGSSSVFLLFDLDGFKHFNDTFGHLAGDALLHRAGARLQRAVDGVGRAYRLGGDEFCAHLEVGSQSPQALIAAATAALSESGPEFAIRASLGVVALPREADTVEGALALADERMYANKRSRSDGARSQASEVLLRVMHVRRPSLDRHSRTVATLAERVAERFGVDGDALDEIARAAELHDIGKLALPEVILDTPGGLDDAEWELVHQHTILGEQILHGAPSLRSVAAVVRASHERWDGRGYPDRLRAHEIPFASRIVGVCDAYEAMTAGRAYRSALSHAAACDELRRASGTQFDPEVVRVFLEVVELGSDARADAGAPGREAPAVSVA